MRRILVAVVLIASVAAACGGEGGSDEADQPAQTTTIDDGTTSTADVGDGSEGGEGDAPADGEPSGGDDDGGPPDDDAAEIIGNPDLDLDDLPDWVVDELDSIDDRISIGECDAAGLRATAPDGWVCRVFDEPIGNLDGFTMFTQDTDLTISISTPTPLGTPCELMQACDEVEPIALGNNFPDTTLLDFMGTITIHGTHTSVDADLVVSKASALTPDELELVKTVVDSVEPS